MASGIGPSITMRVEEHYEMHFNCNMAVGTRHSTPYA